MQKVVLVVAGGSGSRMKSKLPKQFIEIKGKPILMHTIEKFYNYDSLIEIRVVLPKEHINLWCSMVQKFSFKLSHEVYSGGSTRFHSVKNGLKDIPENSIVAIHDGVRPLVNTATIDKAFRSAIQHGTAVPVIDVHETLRKVEGLNSVTVDRHNFKLVQTPQVFNAEILLAAYEQNYRDTFTDDASVLEANGERIHLVEGNRENIKVTTREDLKIAESYFN